VHPCTNGVVAPRRGLACPAALLAALLSLALVPAAGAVSGFGARVLRATAIARQYFHDRQTCPAGVLASWGRLAGLNPDRSAGMAAEAFPGTCAVVYNADVFDSANFGAVAYRWPMFCTLTVHEFGHLAGLGHSTDPRSIMYPIIRAPIRACTR
jgi:hypothetical protein